MTLSTTYTSAKLSFLAPTGALGVAIWDLHLSMCVYFTLCNRALRMAPKEFLKYFKEFSGGGGEEEEQCPGLIL